MAAAAAEEKPRSVGGEPVEARRRRRDKRRGWRRAVVAATLACLHVPAAVYLSVWHQSGALSAVDAVAERIPAVAETRGLCASGLGGAEAGGEGGGIGDAGQGLARTEVEVHFLMPCHAAPLHTHLHFRDLRPTLWSLDCSPE